MKFDHLGVICLDLTEAKDTLEALFRISEWTHSYSDPIQRVDVCFGRDESGMVYELIAPHDDQSPVSDALKNRSNILNHVAYRVPDIARAEENLIGQGCIPISEANPAAAFQGALIQFFFSPLGFIFELIELDHDLHHFK